MGGGVFHLQMALGHTSLEMSRRYANLAAADLVAAHRSLKMVRTYYQDRAIFPATLHLT